MTPRVVLDTNVVLSALIFSRGRFAWLREAWQSGRIRPLVCRATAEELIAVLAYPKFSLVPTERDELLADYLPWCETVVLPEPLPEVPKCRDPGDEPFLCLAVAAGADCLVTGDGDLQALAGRFEPPILTVEALRRLDTSRGSGSTDENLLRAHRE